MLCKDKSQRRKIGPPLSTAVVHPRPFSLLLGALSAVSSGLGLGADRNLPDLWIADPDVTISCVDSPRFAPKRGWTAGSNRASRKQLTLSSHMDERL